MKLYSKGGMTRIESSNSDPLNPSLSIYVCVMVISYQQSSQNSYVNSHPSSVELGRKCVIKNQKYVPVITKLFYLVFYLLMEKTTGNNDFVYVFFCEVVPTITQSVYFY